MNGISPLTWLTLLPFAAGIALLIAGRRAALARGLALGTGFAVLVFSLALWAGFDSRSGAMQFTGLLHEWIPSLAVQYHVGLDGLGLLMVLLTSLVTLMSLVASGGSSGANASGDATSEYSPGLYYALVLFLEAGLLGTFTALNFFHWFLYWELSLIPAFFLVRLWGGPGRAAAATQFFVYTMVGSIALLLAFLALWLATGTFDFAELASLASRGRLLPALSAALGWHGLSTRALGTGICVLALLAFAVKVPLMPFHTWLPATYAEAPTPVTMLLTGAMSKMGLYGFLRILLPIFPEPMQWLRTPLLVLAVISVVFSAAAAFAQRDLKRVFAYSSVNHLGYCLLAIFAVALPAGSSPAARPEAAAALSGTFLQMFNHGLTAAAIFWFVALLERRTGGRRGLNDFGGLRKVAPVFCGLMGISLFSSLGLPGLNGFVGEFLIFKGVFPLASCSASLSVLGLLLTAVFILTVLQRVFNGPLNGEWAGFADLTLAERVALAAPIALMFVLGIYPQLLLGMFNGTVMELVNHIGF
jgi:NADH-quinone oxidoreductase subunit M